MKRDKRTDHQKLIDLWRWSSGNPPYTFMSDRKKRANGVKIQRSNKVSVEDA